VETTRALKQMNGNNGGKKKFKGRVFIFGILALDSGFRRRGVLCALQTESFTPATHAQLESYRYLGII